MKIDSLDHLVLTVCDVEVTCAFYQQVLGMEVVTFGAGRKALVFGRQKINLHAHGQEIAPHAQTPMPGSADLCFLTSVPVATIAEHLQACGVQVLRGPVARTGARSPLLSLYFRDPDQNLIEVSNETPGPPQADEKT